MDVPGFVGDLRPLAPIMSLETLKSLSNEEKTRREQHSRSCLLPSPDQNHVCVYNNEFGTLTRGHSLDDICSASRFGPSHNPPIPRNIRCIQMDFNMFGTRITQYFTRKRVERGLKLYMRNQHKMAVKVWLSALRVVKHRIDKFILLGHLYQAYMDFGRYRDSIDFANRRLSIAEELDSGSMRGEAYMNLARSHQLIGSLDRAMSYGRHALYNVCLTGSFAGNIHLTVADVHMEIGHFPRAMAGMQLSLNIARNVGDNCLLLQVYISLSVFWSRLRDVERALACATKACDIGRGPLAVNLNTRFHRQALIQMAIALRIRGDLGDAYDYSSEALRMCSKAGDQGSYARAIKVVADVYRNRCDIGKALRHYEMSMGACLTLGDRQAQMEAMDGAARCLEALRLQGRICHCRPLEFNTRLLEVVTNINSMLLAYSVRERLVGVYDALGDSAAAKRHSDAKLKCELPHCAKCHKRIGARPENLAALPCSHIVHQACMPETGSRRHNREALAQCEECTNNNARGAIVDAPPAPPPPPPRVRPRHAKIEFPCQRSNQYFAENQRHQATSTM